MDLCRLFNEICARLLDRAAHEDLDPKRMPRPYFVHRIEIFVRRVEIRVGVSRFMLGNFRLKLETDDRLLEI